MTIYNCYNHGMAFDPLVWQAFIRRCLKKFYAYHDGRPSMSAFARHYGLLPQTVFNWDLAKIKDRPSENQYMKLVTAFGPEVYEALDLPIPPRPNFDPLVAFVPASLHNAVLEAREEYTTELESKGIDEDSPEAREIVIKAFTKRGLKVTISE